MTGEQLIPASQQDTWRALQDPDVIKDCVPGCESIARVNDNEYQVQMTARVGPVSAKFRGRLSMFDIKAPQSYALAFEGQGGPAGFAKGGAQVKLAPQDGQTRLSYDVKASVGGKLAQIGSRLVDAAAKKVADDFFRNFTLKLSPEGSEDDTVVIAHGKKKPAPHGAPAAAEAQPGAPRISDAAAATFAAAALIAFFAGLYFYLR